MPELPEVQTTVTGLSRTIIGLKIMDVWTDYNSPYFKGSHTIKDPVYYTYFRKEVIGKKIIGVSRRAKNILIHLESATHGVVGNTILIHMKMTGHLMYGDYNRTDPFNRFIHLIWTLSNGKTLELSDMRKFAKVTLLTDAMNNGSMTQSVHLKGLGPEPLDKKFTFNIFKERLHTKPHGKIKTILMDQSIISGIGNIYSDEALFRAGIHPEKKVSDISNLLLKRLYEVTIFVLKKGIDFGGDSMSDYRNIDGERGKFQGQHQAYRKTGTPCTYTSGTGKNARKCPGIIQRKVVGGRSAHFCSVHQKFR